MSLEELFKYNGDVRQEKWILNLLQLEKVWTASPQACADRNPHTRERAHFHPTLSQTNPKQTCSNTSLGDLSVGSLWTTHRHIHTRSQTHTNTSAHTSKSTHSNLISITT